VIKLEIDMNKPLYCIDKETGEKFLVDGIFFPLGKPSGKDITIRVEKDMVEWRTIDEIEILDNTN